MAWQFELTEGGQETFERFYGADGPWAALSRRSRSYLGSSFLRDQVQPTRYLLIEYWSEMVVYEEHYAALLERGGGARGHAGSIVPVRHAAWRLHRPRHPETLGPDVEPAGWGVTTVLGCRLLDIVTGLIGVVVQLAMTLPRNVSTSVSDAGGRSRFCQTVRTRTGEEDQDAVTPVTSAET